MFADSLRLVHKNKILLLGSCWLLLQLIIAYRFGIETDFEARKYISEADSLISHGHYSSLNFLFYSVEILLITLSKSTHTFPWSPVAIHLIVNGASVLAFYKLCQRFTPTKWTPFIATLAFLSFYYYHLYNFYLFTESLFFSFGILYTYFIFSLKRFTLKTALLLFLALSLLYFTRPVGIFYIPATVVFIVLRFYKKKAFLLLSSLTMIGLALMYLLINFALDSGGEFDFLLPYVQEMIICGVPTLNRPHNIAMTVEKNSVEGLLYVVTHHSELFLKLAGKRFLAFFGIIRSHYSLLHNVFIAAYFYSAYVFILFRLRLLFRQNGAETAYFFTLIGFTLITVLLSCDEWHNRFILALLPFFLLMASKSAQHTSTSE